MLPSKFTYRIFRQPLWRQLLRQNHGGRYFSTSQAHPQQQQPNGEAQRPETTDFGFETVAESLKTSKGELGELRAYIRPQTHLMMLKVGAVFSSVASSYDTMNDAMSLGIHRLWKDYFVRSINPGTSFVTDSGSDPVGWNILDVAGGTGDVAFRLLDHADKINGNKSTKVTIADINTSMLSEGKKRSFDTAYGASPERLNFVEGNAEDLHTIPSDSLDLYTVAFGIRNFTDKPAALREAHRVLKPGGLFACLEFSKVNNDFFNAVYKRWSFSAIPMIGQLVAADRDSYQYLVESIEKFPSQTEFRDMLKVAGFVVPGEGFENLTGGIAAIHKGVKPTEAHRENAR